MNPPRLERPAPATVWHVGDARPAVGRWKLGLALIVVIVATATWTARYHATFRSLRFPDASDYAQMGRQIYRGQGLTSLQTFPYELGWLRAHGHPTAPPWPNLHRFPLITLMNAAAFAVVAPDDRGVALVGGVSLVLLALVVFLLGNRLAGPVAGLVAAVLSFTNSTQLGYSLSGLTETGAALFIVSTAILLLRACESDRFWGGALGLGAVLGLGFLHRYNLVLLAPAAVLLLVWRLPRPHLRVAALAIGFVVVTTPWFIHNAVRFGDLQVSLTSDRNAVKGIIRTDLFLSFDQVDVGALAIEHLDVIQAKLSRGWLLRSWPRLFGRNLQWLGLAVLASILVLRSRSSRRVWVFGVLGFFLTLFAMLATYVEVRFFVPFAPLALCIVVAAAANVTSSLPHRARASVPLAAILVVAMAFAPLIVGFRASRPKRPAHYGALRGLEKAIPSGAVVASDVSWKVAWYCDRPSVRFRGDPAQIIELDQKYVRVDAVFLGRKRATTFAKKLAASELAYPFRRARQFTNGSVLWLRTATSRRGAGRSK